MNLSTFGSYIATAGVVRPEAHTRSLLSTTMPYPFHPFAGSYSVTFFVTASTLPILLDAEKFEYQMFPFESARNVCPPAPLVGSGYRRVSPLFGSNSPT